MRPGGRVVEELLGNFVPPARKTDSTPESQLLQLLRAAGLPEPVPQHRVDLSPTRWARLDFAWPEAKVYCEFDPYKWHGGRDKYMRDNNRRLELADLGWYGVPVTDDELDSGARLATRLLRRHLAARRLTEPLRRCVPDPHTCVGHRRIRGQRWRPARRARRAWRAIARSIRRSSSAG